MLSHHPFGKEKEMEPPSFAPGAVALGDEQPKIVSPLLGAALSLTASSADEALCF